MFDFLTLTLNPSLDLSADTETVVAGPKLRLGEPVVEPGGGGVNAARAAVAMGAQVRAVVALGGATGARIRSLLTDSGVSISVFELDGETRQSLAVTETATGKQYRFVLPGARWRAAQAQDLIARLADETRRMGAGGVLVVSGSQPPGVAPGFALDLVQALPRIRVIVDTSGAALAHLVSHPRTGAMPHVLRMDQDEAEGLAGRPLPLLEDSLGFARSLVAGQIARVVIVARGAEGSVLVSADSNLHCVPPRVDVVSKVGAGDSFTGLFALALSRGEPLDQALRLGTAAAAAAVMTPATALCRADDVVRLAPACTLNSRV